jgi:hypothetical protein
MGIGRNGSGGRPARGQLRAVAARNEHVSRGALHAIEIAIRPNGVSLEVGRFSWC